MLNETGYPIVSQPLTLKAVSSKRPFHGDWDEMLVWHEYEKKTGVHIEWDLLPWGERATKKNVILASGDLPDFFMSVGLTLDEVIRYGGEGMFIRLNELIDTYGSNIQEMFKQVSRGQEGDHDAGRKHLPSHQRAGAVPSRTTLCQPDLGGESRPRVS